MRNAIRHGYNISGAGRRGGAESGSWEPGERVSTMMPIPMCSISSGGGGVEHPTPSVLSILAGDQGRSSCDDALLCGKEPLEPEEPPTEPVPHYRHLAVHSYACTSVPVRVIFSLPSAIRQFDNRHLSG